MHGTTAMAKSCILIMRGTNASSKAARRLEWTAGQAPGQRARWKKLVLWTFKSFNINA